LHRMSLVRIYLLFGLALPSVAFAQTVAPAVSNCDSVLRAARVDSTHVTARAVLVRRDGELFPPRARDLLLASIISRFQPPQPLQLPVFGPGPVRMRMLRLEHLGDDSLVIREPVLYGVYDFAVYRSGGTSRVLVTVPSMSPGFDASMAAAVGAASADSVPAVVARALDTDTLALELRISTGAPDSRFRVPPAPLFAATFPRLRMVDARPRENNPIAEYPEEERDEGRDGEVMLRVVVNASGVAVIPSLEILHATSPEFALSAARTLARYQFTPAHVGMCAVPQVVDIPFWFSLRP
jgi:TonB family protein